MLIWDEGNYEPVGDMDEGLAAGKWTGRERLLIRKVNFEGRSSTDVQGHLPQLTSFQEKRRFNSCSRVNL